MDEKAYLQAYDLPFYCIGSGRRPRSSPFAHIYGLRFVCAYLQNHVRDLRLFSALIDGPYFIPETDRHHPKFCIELLLMHSW